MTAGAGFVFWLSLLGILYAYFGYPLILFFCYGVAQILRDLRYLMNRRDRRQADRPAEALPALSMLIAAYNEEELQEKISNIAALDYPADKFQVVIVSDGSSDGTNPHSAPGLRPAHRGRDPTGTRWKSLGAERRPGARSP